MSASAPLRDRWVAGGLALLAALTLGTLLLYRGAPQSVAEARSRTWVAVSPDAYTPRIARANERLRAAAAAAQAGDTASAVRVYATAAEEARAAGENAETEPDRRAAVELWARALLDRAELMLRAGDAPWWRRDDEAILREALASVERVATAPTMPETRARAEGLAQALRRKLRPGPLEWIPRP
jgi:hypothetical protein